MNEIRHPKAKASCPEAQLTHSVLGTLGRHLRYPGLRVLRTPFISLVYENERKLTPYIQLEMAQNSLNSRFPETSAQLKQLIATRQLCLLRSSLQNLLRKSEIKESSQ